MDDLYTPWDETVTALEEAREGSQLPAEYFAFRIALARSAAEEAAGISVDVTPPDLGKEDMGNYQLAGNTLMGTARLDVDPDRFRDRVAAVGRVFADHNMAFGQDLEDHAQKEGGGIFLDWVEKLLKRDRYGLDGAAEPFGIEGPTLAFFLAEAARPFLRAIGEKLRDAVDEEKWRRGYCGVCGAHPSFSFYRGEGRARYLVCAACDSLWKFIRVTCPFCGEKESKNLTFLQYEDDPRYRIDACRSCKRYIKALDMSELVEGTKVALAAEEAKTLYLDLAAEKEGYGK